MSVGETSVGQTSVGLVSVGQISVRQTSGHGVGEERVCRVLKIATFGDEI
jgi:hypothetical protein